MSHHFCSLGFRFWGRNLFALCLQDYSEFGISYFDLCWDCCENIQWNYDSDQVWYWEVRSMPFGEGVIGKNSFFMSSSLDNSTCLGGFFFCQILDSPWLHLQKGFGFDKLLPFMHLIKLKRYRSDRCCPILLNRGSFGGYTFFFVHMLLFFFVWLGIW